MNKYVVEYVWNKPGAPRPVTIESTSDEQAAFDYIWQHCNSRVDMRFSDVYQLLVTDSEGNKSIFTVEADRRTTVNVYRE